MAIGDARISSMPCCRSARASPTVSQMPVMTSSVHWYSSALIRGCSSPPLRRRQLGSTAGAAPIRPPDSTSTSASSISTPRLLRSDGAEGDLHALQTRTSCPADAVSRSGVS